MLYLPPPDPVSIGMLIWQRKRKKPPFFLGKEKRKERERAQMK